MAVNVQIPAPMRQHTGGKAAVQADGADVGAVLAGLVAGHPGLADRLFDGGQLKRFVNVFVNDEDIRYLGGLQTPVKDGDDVAIIPAVAGG